MTVAVRCSLSCGFGSDAPEPGVARRTVTKGSLKPFSSTAARPLAPSTSTTRRPVVHGGTRLTVDARCCRPSLAPKPALGSSRPKSGSSSS